MGVFLLSLVFALWRIRPFSFLSKEEFTQFILHYPSQKKIAIFYAQWYNFFIKYKIEFKPRVIKDCKSINKKILRLIFSKIEILSDALQGDVKKLTNYSPEYCLRAGDYRILFETENERIIIYRIMHRKEAYR